MKALVFTPGTVADRAMGAVRIILCEDIKLVEFEVTKEGDEVETYHLDISIQLLQRPTFIRLMPLHSKNAVRDARNEIMRYLFGDKTDPMWIEYEFFNGFSN